MQVTEAYDLARKSSKDTTDIKITLPAKDLPTMLAEKWINEATKSDEHEGLERGS